MIFLLPAGSGPWWPARCGLAAGDATAPWPWDQAYPNGATCQEESDLGYAAFAVSKSQLGEVEDYLRKQREDHCFKTFQEEYRAFLDRHEIAYDERYLWD